MAVSVAFQQRCEVGAVELTGSLHSPTTAEVELANNLVEDPNNDAMSYVDYLCHCHRSEFRTLPVARDSLPCADLRFPLNSHHGGNVRRRLQQR